MVKIVYDDDILVNEGQIEIDIFEQIKNHTFSNDVFNWFIMTRKNPNDIAVYEDLLNKRNLEYCANYIKTNSNKNGNLDMDYDNLVDLYLSKQFNIQILSKMLSEVLA